MKYKVIKPKDIKVGMVIRDKFGYQGKVVENTHPWGFKRFQYKCENKDGTFSWFTIINHPDPEWYSEVSK